MGKTITSRASPSRSPTSGPRSSARSARIPSAASDVTIAADHSPIFELEQLADNSLRQSLTRLAEAIRAEEVGKVIGHELPAREGRALVRSPPLDDAQLSFFVPSIHDAPIKDDFNLMDIAPFALSKTTGEGVIRYELKDSIITVEGGAQVGLATAYDYDIVISMISHLGDATRRYRIDNSKGLRPTLPPRVYRPAASRFSSSAAANSEESSTRTSNERSTAFRPHGSRSPT